jgi:hypothetical protein
VRPATEDAADFIGGFVAGEGTFVCSGTPPRFTFAVGLGATDTATCLRLRSYFACGNVFSYARRKPHYDDECTFSIQSIRDHLRVTIPFMDAHLPVSYKREQYRAWRDRLIEYWEHDAKRVRPCTVDGCDEPRRAHGLCRHHLYAARGV